MFETRERAEEAKFVHQRDVEFQVHARRDRMFGRWAARLMGMKAGAIDDYARYLVASDIAGTDDELIKVVSANLEDCGVVGVKASADRLRRKLERFHALAQAHLGAKL
jgi:hypothetical protein